jgi:hypothetical protein
MKKIQIIVIIAIFSFLSVYSQKSNLGIISGKITDIDNAKPVGTEILFCDSKGKKINAKSNSLEGTYTQVLNGGEVYNIYFKGYVTQNLFEKLDLSWLDKYKEITQDFSVIKIREGLLIGKSNPFSANEDAVNAEKLAYLKKFKELSGINPGTTIVITISAADSKFKELKKKVEYKDKKNKTKTKSVKVTPQEQADELIQKRIESLKKYLAELKIPEKNVSFIVDNKVSAKEPKKEKPAKKKGKGSKSSDSGSTVSSVEITTVTVNFGKPVDWK